MACVIFKAFRARVVALDTYKVLSEILKALATGTFALPVTCERNGVEVKDR